MDCKCHFRLVHFVLSFVSAVQSALLLANRVNELSCPDIQDIPKADPSTVDFNLLNSNEEFSYIPMSSQHSARVRAEIFLSRPAKSQAELRNINFSSEFIYRGCILLGTEYGYNRKIEEICGPFSEQYSADYQDFCVIYNGSPGTDISVQVSTLDTLLWTDNKEIALYTSCVNGRYFNWTVWSSKESLTKQQEKTILSKISSIGFDPKKVIYFY